VSWTFLSVDRCTGEARTLPGASLAVAPGSSEVQAVTEVPLPRGHALALIAMTDSPATAASPPVLMPPDQSSC
jgi:hypothetical protein